MIDRQVLEILSAQIEDNLLTLFRQIRTPQGSPKRPFLRQEWLAEWFNTHQELISRWQRYMREGGLHKLNGESDGWIVTPEIQQAILDIWVPNFWLSAAQVCERLLAADHITSLELTYRFTPFAQDNRPVKGRKLDIRKCPLELAGYDVSKIPIALVVRGQLLGWPPETLRELVPNA